jgi:HK97 family phage major capsid protein
VSDQIIRQDITDAIALKLESQLIDGDGTGYNLKGLVAHTGFTASGVTVSGARFRVKDASSMIAAIEAADELRTGGRYGFLMRPRVKWGLKKERAEMYSGQSANDGVPIIVNAPIMTDEQLQAAIGYKIGSTSLIEFTSATLSPVYFGNWAQLYVGIWRDFWIKASDVAVDSSGNSMMTQDSTLIVAFQEVDAAVIRETAFTKVTGADSTEANWS